MTHLHFNMTLGDLYSQFQMTLATYLKEFSELYYPPVRTIRTPTYLFNKRRLEASPVVSQNLIDLCCSILFSSAVRSLDGQCIVSLMQIHIHF